MIMANYMPDDKASLVDNSFWKVLFTVQAPFQILAIVLHTWIFTEDTLDYNIKKGNEEEAVQLIRKIHPESSEEVQQEMYDTKRNDYLEKIEAQGQKVDSAWVALTDQN